MPSTQRNLRDAQYEQMEDGQWYASIPGCDGLWVTGATVEDARNKLHEALDGWLYVKSRY